MLIGYARISSAGENLEPQVEALNRAGVDQVFVDVASGAKVEHPQRERAESLLRERDILVVWSIDRLDLNISNVVKMIEGLARRGVGFRSLKDNIDTTSGTHIPISFFFAALAQCERDLTLERSAAGRAAVKISDRKGGRKSKLNEEERAQALTLYYDEDVLVEDICRKLKISSSTFFRLLRQGDNNKPERKPKAKTTDAMSKDEGTKLGENCPGPVAASKEHIERHPDPAGVSTSARSVSRRLRPVQ